MIDHPTPGGRTAHFVVRDGTTDADMVSGMLRTDEYRLKGRDLSGWALDIGAHIGCVSVLLALDYPDLRVVAVEPVPENAEQARENVRLNHLEERVTVLCQAAAGPGVAEQVVSYGYRHYEGIGDGYTSAHRFVGGMFASRGDPEFSPSVPAVSLDALLSRFGIAEVALLKIDCEGCEWGFLDTPAVAKVRTIVGEYHAKLPDQVDYTDCPKARLLELLAATHAVEFLTNEPIIGNFEARRK